MIQEFAQYLGSLKGYSDNTVKAYKKDCQEFAHYIKQHTTCQGWRDITRKEVDAYIVSLANKGLSPSSTNRKLSSISAIFKYMQREGMDVQNPCKYESRRKVGERIPSTINPDEIREAYEQARGNAKIMLGVLASTGIRISELLRLTWDDVDLTNCVLTVHGKGMRDRQVICSREVAELLEERKQGRDLHCIIFGMGQRTARHIIWEALQPYSIAKQLSPHAIRHTFATEMAKQGANTATIAKILGHKHISTTQKYIDMAQIPATNAGIC